MRTYITIKDILPTDMTSQQLLEALRQRIRKVNQGKDALERGDAINNYFPAQARRTILLAEQAMNGMLVLPGTGPELYFVGNPPKWEYNPVNDNEYTFHLNRMHHVKTLAEAYSLSGNLDYARKAIEELDDWITRIICPPLVDEHGDYTPLHFNGLTPWRALEVGIRGYRTWPIIIELLAETPYFTTEFLEKLICSIYTHCQILYHISPLLWPKADHNHYLMENLGLMSFSLLFPEMRDSASFLQHSQKELDRCMEAQCTACGGQIEGCPSYHNGCVFWFAMRIVFARKFQIDVPQEYSSRLESMFCHSVAATRPCGGNFPWGDSHTWKETMSLAAVSCFMAYSDPKYLEIARCFYSKALIMEDIRDNLWRISDLEGLWRSISSDSRHDETHPSKNSSLPASSGLSLPLTAWQKDLNQVYVRTGWEKDDISFMTACRTPVQNLHAHIDAGGFDFVAYGEPLVADPGIYTYKDDENRKHFKSAFWHNCLTVNRQNMWEYQASWGYGPQKDGSILSVTEKDHMITIVSCHRNYEPAIATRCLSLIDNRFLVVLDQVSGLSKGDSVQIHFHLDRTFIKETTYGLITQAAGRPNVELAWGNHMKLQMEVGKISTANDVWHDSMLVHLEHLAEKEETFYHAAIIIPHRAEDKAVSCLTYETQTTPQGFSLTFCLDTHTYRLLWDGETLINQNP